ncbi:hypothetical protein ACJX0J_031521, partial [Zea mays]
RTDLLVSGAKVRLKSDNEIAGAFNYLGAELLGKLARTRIEDDLKPCRDLIEQLFGKEK